VKHAISHASLPHGWYYKFLHSLLEDVLRLTVDGGWYSRRGVIFDPSFRREPEMCSSDSRTSATADCHRNKTPWRLGFTHFA
jgi:hypothetical protein